MNTPNVVNFEAYRTSYDVSPELAVAPYTVEEDLGLAMQSLIRRMRDGDPIKPVQQSA